MLWKPDSVVGQGLSNNDIHIVLGVDWGAAKLQNGDAVGPKHVSDQPILDWRVLTVILCKRGVGPAPKVHTEAFKKYV